MGIHWRCCLVEKIKWNFLEWDDYILHLDMRVLRCLPTFRTMSSMIELSEEAEPKGELGNQSANQKQSIPSEVVLTAKLVWLLTLFSAPKKLAQHAQWSVRTDAERRGRRRPQQQIEASQPNCGQEGREIEKERGINLLWPPDFITTLLKTGLDPCNSNQIRLMLS